MAKNERPALRISLSIRGEKPWAEHFELAHLEWVKRLARRYREERIEAGGSVRLSHAYVPSHWSLPELEDIMERVAS